MTTCPFCGSPRLSDLPLSLPQALRSDGFVIDEPLSKRNCPDCGVLTGQNSDPGHAYQRSNGIAPNEIARHDRIAKGLDTLLTDLGVHGPEILEVGAANFHTALALGHLRPAARITALEPSPELVPDTDLIKLHICGFEDFPTDRLFEVIYSNHVLEHIPDTTAFLREMAARLASEGYILISCPNGLIPSHELLFSDHLFHFTPTALAHAANRAGLRLETSFATPWEPLSMLFILRHGSGDIPEGPGDLSDARRTYLSQWETAEARLLEQIPDEIVLFGAGEFSQLIHAYLPRVFERVTTLTVDTLEGTRAFPRPIIPLSDLNLDGRTVLLGLHPASVPTVAKRLAGMGAAQVLGVF